MGVAAEQHRPAATLYPLDSELSMFAATEAVFVNGVAADDGADARCPMLDVPCSMLDACCSMPDAWCPVPDARCAMLDARCLLLDA